MDLFQDIKSIRSGEAKARRDIAAIERFKANHDEHVDGHECDAFWDGLGSGLSDDDPIEQGAYVRVAGPYRKKLIDEASLKQIVIEASGVNSMDDLVERVRRALSEEDAFNAVVSETPDNPSPDSSNQKGGNQ